MAEVIYGVMGALENIPADIQSYVIACCAVTIPVLTVCVFDLIKEIFSVAFRS